MPAELIYNREGLGKVSFKLDKDCVKIGRASSNDLLLDFDSEVSSKHSQITRHENSYFIEDLGSTNKTFVNDIQINSRTQLKNNDIILIGQMRFTFISGAAQPVQDNMDRTVFSSNKSPDNSFATKSVPITDPGALSGKNLKKNNQSVIYSFDVSSIPSFESEEDTDHTVFAPLSESSSQPEKNKPANPGGNEERTVFAPYSPSVSNPQVQEDRTIFAPQQKPASEPVTLLPVKTSKEPSRSSTTSDKSEKNLYMSGTLTKKRLNSNNRLKIIIAVTCLAVLITAIIYYVMIDKGQKLDDYYDDGKKFYKEGHFGKAIKKYEDILKIDKYYLRAYHGLGDVYIALPSYEKAIEQYKSLADILKDDERVKKLDSDDRKLIFKTFNYIGNASFLNNNYSDAEFWYKANWKMDYVNELKDNIAEPDMLISDALVGLARIDTVNHKYKDAADKYKNALDKKSSNIKAVIGLGNLYVTMREYEKAKEYFDKAIGADPNNVDADLGIAEIYKKREKYNDAIKEYDRIIEDHGRLTKAYIGKAEVLRIQKKYDDARDCLDEAEELRPWYEITKKTINDLEDKFNDDKLDKLKAIKDNIYSEKELKDKLTDDKFKNKDINLILEKSSKNKPEIFLARAQIDYYDGKKYDDALKELDKALEIHPNFIEAKNWKAKIFGEQKKIGEAKELYDNVLKSDPENFEANRGMGKILLDSHEDKKYDDSIKFSRKANDIDPADREVYINLGDAYYGKEDYHNAAKNYESAFGIKKDKKVCNKLGDTYDRLGDSGKSTYFYNAADDVNE